jgi:hypoxanthine phosphoribosyltransferase
MIRKFMADKLIITFEEYNKIVEKLAIEIHKNYKPTVLVGIMRGAAPILDILSRILKLTNSLYCYSELLRRGNGRQTGPTNVCKRN